MYVISAGRGLCISRCYAARLHACFECETNSTCQAFIALVHGAFFLVGFEAGPKL